SACSLTSAASSTTLSEHRRDSDEEGGHCIERRGAAPGDRGAVPRRQRGRLRTHSGNQPRRRPRPRARDRDECEPDRALAPRRLRVPLPHYAPDVRVRGAFYGQTSRGDAYRKGVTVEALIHLLGTLEPGTTELRCHPGEDERWEGPYREERPLELATLCTAT